MWTNQSVRQPAAQVLGVPLGGDSVPFYRYLSDYQLGGVAAFVYAHSYCESERVSLTWDESLSVVLAVEVHCPSCVVSRTYPSERG